MKIRYSKRRLHSNLVLGGMFTLFGILKAFEGTASYFTYFQLLLGISMAGTFFYQKKHQYLSLENGLLTKNGLRRKTVQLDKILQVQSFPGRIKVYTSEKSLGINISINDEDSSHDLYRVLGSLKRGSQENPFLGSSPASS